MGVVLEALVLLCFTGSWAYSMDLNTLLRARAQNNVKRAHDGNPCTNPEEPFPCKGSSTCIPMSFVCDDSDDCEDGYDENQEVCTAFHRPPVQDIEYFLSSEKSWILPVLFKNKPIRKIAHGLAVSQTIDDFKRRLNLNKNDVQNLREAVRAVENEDEAKLEELGMPASAWHETYFMFRKLIKSGFQ